MAEESEKAQMPRELENRLVLYLTPEQAKVMDALRGRERIPPTRNAYAQLLVVEALVQLAGEPNLKPKRKPRAKKARPEEKKAK